MRVGTVIGSLGFEGDFVMGELGIYDIVLSSGDEAELITHLQAKWGATTAPTVPVTTYWQNGEQVASYDGTTLRFLHVDHLGSPAVATDASGDLLWERREFPFGDMRVDDPGATGTERFFTGQIEDADAGLYFYNARYLETGIGRFISPDSIVPNPSDPRDHNRYNYVRNNPLKYTDESGYCPWCLAIAVGAGVDLGIQLYDSVQSGDGVAWSNVNWVNVAQGGVIGGATGGGATLVKSLFTRTASRIVGIGVVGSAGQALSYDIDKLQGEALPTPSERIVQTALSGLVSAGFSSVTDRIFGKAVEKISIAIPAAVVEAGAGVAISEAVSDYWAAGSDTYIGLFSNPTVTSAKSSPATYLPIKIWIPWSYYSGEDEWR